MKNNHAQNMPNPLGGGAEIKSMIMEVFNVIIRKKSPDIAAEGVFFIVQKCTACAFLHRLSPDRSRRVGFFKKKGLRLLRIRPSYGCCREGLHEQFCNGNKQCQSPVRKGFQLRVIFKSSIDRRSIVVIYADKFSAQSVFCQYCIAEPGQSFKTRILLPEQPGGWAGARAVGMA
jgi:hypothetical protein